MDLINWRKFDNAKPYVSLQIFLFDKTGKFPVVFRGPNVRSVKNKWSPPSGLHEVGLSFSEQARIELMEELNIDARDVDFIPVGCYENIVPEDQWHWVIVMLAGIVNNFDSLKNMEPDKHTDVRLITLDEISQLSPWGQNFEKAVLDNSFRIKKAYDYLNTTKLT